MARPTLMTHRKFNRFARSVGSIALARGILEILWDGCYDSGDDYLGTAADIDQRIGWAEKPGAVALALVACGFPEGHGFIQPVQPEKQGGEITYQVHDLWHHAPDYVLKRRKRELERQQKSGPVLVVGHSAPNGGQCSPSLDCLPEVDRTPAPAPAPALKDSLRIPSAQAVDETLFAAAVTPVAETRLTAQAVVDLWNQLVTAPIPKVTKLTADRRTKIDARLKTYPDLATWRTAITWVNGQDWCRASGRGEHPNWTATIDWLCKTDGVITRCLERLAAERPPAANPTELEQRRNAAKYGAGATR